MHPNPRVRVQQQQRIRRRADQSDAHTFFNLLTSPALLDRVESLLPEHRERLFPPSRLVGLICLGSCSVLDAAIGGYRGQGNDEQTLLRTLLDTLAAGDLLLGDAYFASYFLLCALRERGVEAVFEQQGSRRRSTDFRRGAHLGTRDHLIEA